MVKMIKQILISGLFLLILGLTACGNGKHSTGSADDSNDTETGDTGSGSPEGDAPEGDAPEGEDPTGSGGGSDPAAEGSEESITYDFCSTLDFTQNPTNIGTNLPSGYEPSGADYNDTTEKIYIVDDEGNLSRMNKDGSGITTWNIGGDLEGVAIANESSGLVYLGVENPDGIIEFDTTTGTVLRTFTLTTWMTGADNQGLEALAFVPNIADAEGGLFYAGHQGEGSVYVFRLPIQSSAISTDVTFVTSFVPVANYTDVASLDYDAANDVIFAGYDGPNKLVAVTPSGTFIQEWDLPQDDQEGVALSGNCDVFIAQDTDKKVWYYASTDLSVVVDENIIILLADRLAEAQNDDGSFDWQITAGDPLTPTTTGYQNVTGVTALGFFLAANYGSDVDWQTALDQTATYFDTKMDALLANPSDTANNLSCPNWTFLSWYLQDNPNTTLETETISTFDVLLDARDTTYGDDASIRFDGVANRIIQGRASIPGLIPWDLALCVEGVGAMADISTDFSQDYTDALEFLSDYLNNTFLPAYDTDNSYTYGDVSLALPLYVLATSSEAVTYSDLIDELYTRLVALVDESGLVTNGSANDGEAQSTAYGLLGLKAVDSPLSQRVQDYLESLVDVNGIIIDSATNLETFEIEGEALRALGYTQ